MAWVIFVTVLFCLPQVSPITTDSFNYAGVALFAVLVLAWVLWLTRGRRHYKIPTSAAPPSTLPLPRTWSDE